MYSSTVFRLSALLALSASLAACGTIANDGPVTSEITSAANNKGIQAQSTVGVVFDVMDVNENVAATVSKYRPRILSQTFGFGGKTGNPTIGVGDVLQITIFEAGPDGLFSTKDNKATSIPVTVQPDGNASLPYVGPFHFVGNTLESARTAIVAKLKTRAVEPDVTVNLTENASRSVSVNGAVGKPSSVPLGLSSETIMEVIAKAGGPRDAPYDTYVSLTRKGKTRTVLLQNLISDPSENIQVRPNDLLFVTKEQQTFSTLGSFGKSAKIAMDAGAINLIEAVALAGGADQALADPKGLFVFRYEFEEVVVNLLGKERFNKLISEGMVANGKGLYPIVYRVDLSSPSSMLVAQNFLVRGRDLIYFARHPSTDFLKFMRLISTPLGIVRSVSAL
jgi:polysaccharide biosynthesis/export protein